MTEQQRKVNFGETHVSARLDPATGASRALFICAHGAGGHMNDRGMSQVAMALRDAGLDVLRFNFPYREHGSSRPDPMPRLIECFSAVIAHARSMLAPARVIIGGRSMGGRAASMLAAQGFDGDGLLLLAYPLHPPGQTDKIRDAHLPRIEVPVLCFNGTRDTFCERSLMDGVVSRLSDRWTMHWLDGADHGFHVLKRSGRTDSDVMEEVRVTTSAWLDASRAMR